MSGGLFALIAGCSSMSSYYEIRQFPIGKRVNPYDYLNYIETNIVSAVWRRAEYEKQLHDRAHVIFLLRTKFETSTNTKWKEFHLFIFRYMGDWNFSHSRYWIYTDSQKFKNIDDITDYLRKHAKHIQRSDIEPCVDKEPVVSRRQKGNFISYIMKYYTTKKYEKYSTTLRGQSKGIFKVRQDPLEQRQRRQQKVQTQCRIKRENKRVKHCTQNKRKNNRR